MRATVMKPLRPPAELPGEAMHEKLSRLDKEQPQWLARVSTLTWGKRHRSERIRAVRNHGPGKPRTALQRAPERSPSSRCPVEANVRVLLRLADVPECLPLMLKAACGAFFVPLPQPPRGPEVPEAPIKFGHTATVEAPRRTA